MDEKEKEQALEDLKVIKRMMEATNRVAADNGPSFILFGAYWLIAAFMMLLREKLQGIVNPNVLGMSFIFGILFVIACFVFFNNRLPSRGDLSKVPPHIKKQTIEGTLVILFLGFTVPVLASKVAAMNMIIFMQSLIMGMGFYFVGIFLESEYRVTGLFLLLGVFLMPFYKGSGMVVFALTFGIGMILAGILSRRRWLKTKEEENKSGI